MVARGHRQRPAGLDHDGGGGTADQGRAGHPVARPQRLAGKDRGLEPFGRLMRRAGGEDGVRGTGSSGVAERARDHGQLRLVDLLHGADALDRHSLHHERRGPRR